MKHGFGFYPRSCLDRVRGLRLGVRGLEIWGFRVLARSVLSDLRSSSIGGGTVLTSGTAETSERCLLITTGRLREGEELPLLVLPWLAILLLLLSPFFFL